MDKQLLHNIFNNDDCLAEQKLLDYVNNSLSNIERNEVERHTINCKFCSDAVDGFMAVKNSAANYQSIKKNPFYEKPKNKTIFWFFGVAASVLIIIIFNNLNSIKLDNQFTADRDVEITTEFANQYPITDSVPVGNKHKIKKQEKKLSLESVKINKKKVNTPVQRTPELIIEKSQPNYSTTDFQNDNYPEIEELKNNEEILETKKTRAASIVNSKQKDIQNKLLVKVEESVEIKSQTQADLNKSQEVKNILIVNRDVIDKKFKAEDKTTDSNVIRYKTDSISNLTVQEIKEISVSSNSRKKPKGKPKYFAPSSTLNVAIALYENKEFENAIKQLNTVNNSDPDYFKAQLYIGKSNLKLKRPLVAKKSLTEALNGNKKTKKEAENLLNSIK